MNNNQFTPHAIAALKFAQHEALERGKSHIGPEHILLGLLHERECVAAHVLSELGVEFESARLRVGRIAPAPEGTPDNPYYNAIRFVYDNGLFIGMSDTEFAPIANATRAQAAKILFKFLLKNINSLKVTKHINMGIRFQNPI